MSSDPSNSSGEANQVIDYGPGRLIQRLLAVGIVIAVFVFVARFPVAQLFLAVVFMVYVLVSLRYPDAWLVAVPALLPVLYLTPWSGWLFFDEFDMLLMCTLAAGFWHQRFRSNSIRPGGGSRMVLLMFTLLYLIAVWRGLGAWKVPDFNAWASYYSPLNTLRIAKGYLWALVLYPVWLTAWNLNPARSNRLFTLGVMLGLLGVSVVVLWERGVLHDLVYYKNRYQLLGSLLDFSTEYRITGLFADMHTGGTAIDGYLSLVWPFAALTVFTARSRWLFTLGAVVLLAGLYAMVVTFSRGVYLGFGVAAVLAVLLGYFRYRQQISLMLVVLTLLCSVVALAMSVVAFRSGGVAAIVASLMTFAIGTGYVITAEQRKVTAAFTALAATGVVLCALFAAYAAATSKWANIDTGMGMAISVLCAAVFAVLGAGLNRYWRQHIGIRNRLLISLLLCGVIAAFVPSLFGSRMEQRFSTVREDLQHRIEHWQDAIKVMNDDWSTRLLGQGIGRFPERYFWIKQQARDVGGFVFMQEDGNTYLRFAGAHDVRLGQRVALQPEADYTLSLDVRTSAPLLKMHLRICHRHLIHPTEWNPACASFSKRLESTGGTWKRMEFRFNSNDLGSFKRYLHAPLVLTIANRREYDLQSRPQTLLDFDNLSLRQPGSGKELMRNGGFEHGIDHWFGYYDFNHLPWHIKNLWVHVYFELGIVGLLAFLMLLSASFRGLLKPLPDNCEQRNFSIAALLAMAGFLAVGTFGTLLDAPRVAFLFYLLLLSGLPKQPHFAPAQGRRVQDGSVSSNFKKHSTVH